MNWLNWADVMHKFKCSIAKPCRNKSFWLDAQSHMTIFKQSECVILVVYYITSSRKIALSIPRCYLILISIIPQHGSALLGVVVVVKWLACWPFIVTIRVQIPLKSTFLIVLKLLENNKNKLKRGRTYPTLKNLFSRYCVR